MEDTPQNGVSFFWQIREPLFLQQLIVSPGGSKFAHHRQTVGNGLIGLFCGFRQVCELHLVALDFLARPREKHNIGRF